MAKQEEIFTVTEVDLTAKVTVLENINKYGYRTTIMWEYGFDEGFNPDRDPQADQLGARYLVTWDRA